MAEDAKDEKVDGLIARSSTFSQSGKFQDAANALREALQIDPGNPKIKEAVTNLKKNGDNTNALQLCLDYLENGGDDLGKRAASAAAKTSSDEDAEKIIDSILSHQDGQALVPTIFAAVLSSQAGEKQLAIMLKEKPTATFESLWSHGKDLNRPLTSTILHPSAWSSEISRLQTEKNVFRLFLAKLLEPGIEEPEIAMSSIARILAVDAPKLQEVINTDTFGMILSFLDITHSVELRSQATLALAKLLEAQPDQGRSCLREFVSSKISHRNSEDLITAFSAAGAMFPIVPDMAGELFLTPGFVEDLVRLAERSQSSTLKLSALELLSAACVAKPCREAISKHCLPWLKKLTNDSSKSRDASLAMLILSKLGNLSKENALGVDDLSKRLKDLTVQSNDTSQDNAARIEALAYCSVQPKVKEALANDVKFLKSLISTLVDPKVAGPTLFGGLTILSNLTLYSAPMSAEQKKLSQLKAYANQAKPDNLDHPLNDTVHVAARIDKVLHAGGSNVITKSLRKASPGILQLIITLLLSISKHPIHRKTMAKNGLLQAGLMLASEESETKIFTSDVRLKASLVVARVITYLDPMLVFNPPAVVPFERTLQVVVGLLNNSMDESATNSSGESIDQTITALQALTTIASVNFPTSLAEALHPVYEVVYQHADELLFSNVVLVRRACVQLLCNITASTDVVSQLFGPSSKGDKRLQLLTALYGGDEDMDTRIAAAGALFGLIQQPGGAKRFLGNPMSGQYLAANVPVKSEYKSGSTEQKEEITIRTVAMIASLSDREGIAEDDKVKTRRGASDLLATNGTYGELMEIWQERERWSGKLREGLGPYMQRALDGLAMLDSV